MNLRILIPAFVIAIVLCLFVYFFKKYVKPARLIRKRISTVSKDLVLLKSKSSSNVSKEAVAEIMKTDPTLAHLWSEYEETLHDQHGVNQDGERVVLQTRATVPAEVFFNTQVLVDTPIQAEFFRHLPGILTGIGIIGTFVGLLMGLFDFKTGDLGMITSSVEILLESVRDAFIASAAAICCAMIVTAIEKRMLTKCYQEVEKLTQALDTLYEAGAGEEYLSRLVRSSEESATQTRILKDSLVEDLKQMMTELVERQISAGMDNSRLIANQVGDAITSNFQKPLERLTSAVERTQSGQTEAFKGTLEDLLSAYTASMKEIFGDQIANLNTVMTESVRSLNGMQDGFQRLLADLGNAGKVTNDAMNESLQRMLEQADMKQTEMLKQIAGFVDQMQEQVLKSQSASQDQLNQSIDVFTSQMAVLFAEFKQQRGRMLEDEEEHRVKTLEETQKFVGSVENSLASFTDNMTSVVMALKESTQVLQCVAVKAAEEVNKNVANMNLTAKSFVESGNTLGKTLAQGNTLFEKVVQISLALEQSSKTVQEAVLAYDRTRNTVEKMTAALNEIINEAESRSGLSKELLNDMEKFTVKFSELQSQTKEYMENVSEVLATSFDSFGDSVERNLGRGNAAFATTLTEAVSLLAGLVQEIEDKLEDFNDALDKIIQVRG